MDVAEFDYALPQELIAQEPLEPRDASRLLVIDRAANTIKHRSFRDIRDYLTLDDCLVVNNARVLPARLHGHKLGTGARIELLLLSEVAPDRWEVLVKPGRKVSTGTVINIKGTITAIVEKRLSEGRWLASFEHEGTFVEVLQKVGEVPLPPYIRKHIANPSRYQTVFASKDGAVAAPTAGLHFSDSMIEEIESHGVKWAPVTLDVGLDSFRPVRVSKVEEHRMHSEKFNISEETCRLINATTRRGGRVFTIGTTSARVLETVAIDEGKSSWIAATRAGRTDLFIYPGYEFKVTNALLTNFHLPKSTLLMLVCAFASKEIVMKAYQEAIVHRYRFYSFGDAMLIV